MMKLVEILKEALKMVVILVLVTLVGMEFKEIGIPESNIVVVYILGVLLSAKFTEGYVYGILSSVISIMLFNYFFTAPYHTFDVYDPSYFVTFAIMAITSIITSTSTSKEKSLTREAQERGLESKVLYALTNELFDGDTIDKVITIAVKNISNLLKVNVGFIYFESDNKYIFIQKTDRGYIHRNSSDVIDLYKQLTYLRTEYLEDDEYINFPVNGNDHLLGAIRIDKFKGKEALSEKNKLVHSMIENIAIALDRIVVANARILDKEAVVRERYRANLLRAISHDLRTPLSGIMGTSEMIMDMTDKDDKRFDLVLGIYKDADWLHSLVENILSLTRLRDGKIVVQKEKEALEEVIACSISHIEKSNPDREIQVSLPDEFKLVPMDARLIQQVITNLLDNAIKHTTKDQAIEISVYYEDNTVKVIVKDEGIGINKKDEKNVFQTFYTTNTKSADSKKGVGLGLSICETVVKAHGGTIIGRNRTDKKGAEFIFKLPLEEGETVV